MMKLITIVALLAVCLQVYADEKGKCSCQPGAVDGEGATGEEACANAVAACTERFQDKCDEDCECNESASKCSEGAETFADFPQDRTKPGGDPEFHCKVHCVKRDFKCVKPGGRNDPHFTDFTGKHFDFHGEGGKKYVMFGRQDGDLLVTQMVEKLKQDPETSSVIKKTYFDNFGIRTSSGNKITIKHGDRAGTLSKKVHGALITVDGVNVEKDFETKGLSISFHEDFHRVVMKTNEMIYYIKVIPSKNKEHLDFHMTMQRTPEVTDRYVGVLGMSLNTRIGHEVRTPLVLQKGYDKDAWEKTLRKEFEVDSMHPYYTRAFKMHGIVRMSQASPGFVSGTLVTASGEE